MFRYYLRLYEKYRLPIYPIALLSYASPRKPQPDGLRIAFPDFEALAFNYRVVQLNRLDWRDYLSRPNPVASALMANMKIAKQDRLRVKAERLRLMLTLKLNPVKMRLIIGYLDTYLRLTASEQKQFLATLVKIAAGKRGNSYAFDDQLRRTRLATRPGRRTARRRATIHLALA
jgi:hypothetical protein